MLEKTKFGILPGSRALRAGAAAALLAASIVSGAGAVAASTANSAKTLSQGSKAAWALLIEQRQATAQAAMRKAGVGPSLAGNSGPAER